MDEVPKLIRVPVGDLFDLVSQKKKIVDDDGWILEFRAEYDTK